MESRTSQLNRRGNARRQASGVALVITLCCLVLLSVVVIAFLMNGATERSSASSYATSADAKRLADTAVQIVMGQIRQATTGGPSVAWASQPGMIRTFGATAQAADGLAFYKLYSSDKMAVTQSEIASYDFASDLSFGGSSDWKSQSAIFTDLNAPVLAPDGQLSYPIIDPGAAAVVSGSSTLVEGFSLANAPGYDSGKAANARNNPAPMPVKWLYLLKDGSVTAPTSVNGAGKVASWSGAAKLPSKDNPIVARIAFWADDESCKLNLNTAAGNNYWDSPMFATAMEMEYSYSQPSPYEYTRYPGHPATTSLLPVFWSYGGLSSPDYSLLPNFDPPRKNNRIKTTDPTTAPITAPTLPTEATEYYTKLLNLLPRNAWGGSQAGTKYTMSAMLSGAASNRMGLSTLDNDRLFASVDELIFDPSRNSLATPVADQFQFSKSDVDKLRFFLTTSSRAPEVNQFNLPKISMWPLHDTTATNPLNSSQGTGNDSLSAVDRLLMFCSTINGKLYAFTRNDPTSGTADFSSSTTGGKRNQELYSYLERLMGEPIPGYGASFKNRYGTLGNQQILTECYDYIRGAINLVSANGPAGSIYKYSFARKAAALDTDQLGQVAPIKHPSNGTKGIGRFPTVKQVALMFIARAANQPPIQVDPSTLQPSTPYTINPMHPWVRTPDTGTVAVNPSATENALSVNDINGDAAVYPTLAGQTHAGMPYLTALNPATLKFDKPNPRYQSSVLPLLNPNETQVQALLLIDPVNNSVGFPPLSVNYKLRVSGLKNFFADGVGIYSSDQEDETIVPVNDYGIRYTYALGSGLHNFFRKSAVSTPSGALKFVSLPFIIKPKSGATYGETFQFSGGKLKVEILTANNEVVQTINVNFPASSFPTPLLPIQSSEMIRDTGIDNLDPASPPPPAAQQYAKFPPTSVFDLTPSWMLTFDSSDVLATNPNFGVTGTDYNKQAGWSRLFMDSGQNSYNKSPGQFTIMPQWSQNGDAGTGNYKRTADTVRAMEAAYGDTRVIAAMKEVPEAFFVPHKDYYNLNMRSAHSLRGNTKQSKAWPDTFNYGSTPGYLSDANRITPSLVYSNKAELDKPVLNLPWVNDESRGNAAFPHVTSMANFDTGDPAWTSAWSGLKKFTEVWAEGGDFDNGIAHQADGPYINKPNEGTQKQGTDYWFSDFAGQEYSTAAFIPPNRQVSSPVIFGSLPVPFDSQTASLSSLLLKNVFFWRTLLFCPNPNSQTHPSIGQNPPDYALLDFFNMPVVEPYALSEPFSAAGRVNMNYQIAPFSYIKRDAAVRGVLRSTMLTAVPDSWMKFYKSANREFIGDLDGIYDKASQDNLFLTFRYPIHPTETLKQFEAKFSANQIFKSPSEICSIWLFPASQPKDASRDLPATPLVSYDSSLTGIKSWWYSNAGGTDVTGMNSRKSLTGDNMRERPYSTLYPQLTTKSNSFTVHYRVQVLKQVPGSRNNAADWQTWDEDRDKVVGEHRGSTLIERYVDPDNTSLPDFATASSGTLDEHYNFRVLSVRRFAP